MDAEAVDAEAVDAGGCGRKMFLGRSQRGEATELRASAARGYGSDSLTAVISRAEDCGRDAQCAGLRGAEAAARTGFSGV